MIPFDANPPITEIFINGAWVNTSTASTGLPGQAVRATGGTTGIAITRGQQSEQGRPSPQTSVFAVNNRSGLWANRNPMSPYYGLLPRFTPVRHRQTGMDSYAYFSYSDQLTLREVRTADNAALDITGDMEIRVDLDPRSWQPDAPMTVASKYLVTGNQRSWAVGLLSTGQLRFQWSTDGGNVNAVVTTSALAVPVGLGRAAIRIQLDVNNGSSGWTVSFGYSTTGINGSWLGLGTNPTGTPATSVFSSSAALVIGGGDDLTNPITASTPFGGRIYEVQVRNGLGGTLVADPIFTTQSIGVTTFADAVGNTWTLGGASTRIRISSDGVRYVGELTSSPQAWDPTGRDVYANLTTAGPLSRPSTGQTIQSPMARQFSSLASVGYWPMEDGSSSTQNASTSTVGASTASLYSITMGSDATALPGAASVAAFRDPGSGGGQIVFRPKPSASTGTLFAMYFVTATTFATGAAVFASFFITGGTLRRVDVTMDPLGSWTLIFWDITGAQVASNSTGFGTPSSDPRLGFVGMNILLVQNGPDVQYSVRWLPVETTTTFTGIGPNTIAGQTIGQWDLSKWTNTNSSGIAGLQVGHVFLANTDVGFVTAAVQGAANAYLGETAAARIDRLSAENGVAAEVCGPWGRSAPMGYQKQGTYLDNIYEALDTDGGVLFECRDLDAVKYRTLVDITAKRDLSIGYTSLVSMGTPTEDNTGFYNQITAARTSGSSYTSTVTTSQFHQLGTDVAGLVAGPGLSINPQTDAGLSDAAGWSTHIGSYDVARVPSVGIEVEKLSASLAAQLAALDVGDTVTVTGVSVAPDVIPPDDMPLILRGYTETLTQKVWPVTANTTPAGAYNTAHYDTVDAIGTPRYAARTWTLNASITSSATAFALKFTDPNDAITTTSGSYPFNVVIAGEVITLNTPPSGSTSPQSFTGVTRSVNGIVKAQSAGAAIVLADDSLRYYGK